MSGVQARRLLSLHQRSPSPFLLDSIIITPHTCAPPHHIPSWSPSSVDYLDTWLPSLCLARLPTLICVSMYVHCVFLLPITFGLCARDTSTTLPSGVSRFWLLFCFACWPLSLLLKWPYLHLDPDLVSSSGSNAVPWHWEKNSEIYQIKNTDNQIIRTSAFITVRH